MDIILPNTVPHGSNAFDPNLAPPPSWSIANFIKTLMSSAPAESMVPSTEHFNDPLVGSSRYIPSKLTATHVTDDTLIAVDRANQDWEMSAGHQGPIKHPLPSGLPSLTNSCVSKWKHSAS